MRFKKRVTDVQAEVVRAEANFLLQQYTANSVCPSRNLVPFETYDVLVTLRAVILTLILVQTKVELCTVLNHRLVKRREQYMVLIVNGRNGTNQKTVVLTNVTPYQCGRTISSGTPGRGNLSIMN